MGCLSSPVEKRLAVAIMQATEPFMSATPRPYMRDPFSTTSKGSHAPTFGGYDVVVSHQGEATGAISFFADEV